MQKAGSHALAWHGVQSMGLLTTMCGSPLVAKCRTPTTTSNTTFTHS